MHGVLRSALCHAIIAVSATMAQITPGAGQEPGFWRLDKTEFWTRSGGLSWIGQNGVQVTVRAHDNSKIVIHEMAPRGLYSQTYAIAFHVPDRLIPGEVAPFAIGQFCAEVDRSPQMPLPVKMGPTNLAASFNADAPLNVPEAECVVGRMVKAPEPNWKIPPGRPGATALVKAASIPTFWSPLEQRFYFNWVSETPPVGTAPPKDIPDAPKQAAPQAPSPSEAPVTGRRNPDPAASPAPAAQLPATAEASAVGYWVLERSAFDPGPGHEQLKWRTSAGIDTEVVQRDERQITIHEAEYRGFMSQTYVIRWSVPDRLIPGVVPQFELSATCTESKITPQWPFPVTRIGLADLRADFHPDGYLVVRNPPCKVGTTVQAERLQWAGIPIGRPGATTTVSAQPVGLKQHFHYRWISGPPPADSRRPPVDTPIVPPSDAEGPPPGGTTLPTPDDTTAPSPWTPPAHATGTQPLPSPGDPVMVRNGADGAVTPGATRPTTFTLSVPYQLTQIMTYHYGARIAPGTIALRHDDGTLYGPWQAAGAGNASHPNVYWWVRPEIVLKPGRYTVVDSDPASWSTEAATHGAGIVLLWGRRL